MNVQSYPLGHSARETRRLVAQNQIYGPITRRVLEAAGIGSGMRVLDVGSGAGDVSLMLAELVGPRGKVVGVDMNSAILETAKFRTEAAGWQNISFAAGDVREMQFTDRFDAVVGRWVLMYVPEPAALIRHLASMVRPGGVVAFHEMDLRYPPATFPPTPLSMQLQRWSVPPPGAPGPDARIGAKLFRLFTEAGLPEPELRLEAPIGAGADWPGYDYSAETLRSLLPMLEQISGLDPADIGIDTLAERLRAEVEAAGGVQMLPMIVGAWARKA